ncbi:hypothetical protein KTN00_12120 [Acinetobacter soli]|uniref:hypothetical protein n=1 Tax=Acinetobacter soli TaxID=487316 RepID=UPI001C46A80E|nr:hypothetical protein [Acinetobacter soli]MBV6551761.1 hypothetical protein [Acinetobacter soli]
MSLKTEISDLKKQIKVIADSISACNQKIDVTHEMASSAIQSSANQQVDYLELCRFLHLVSVDPNLHEQVRIASQNALVKTLGKF